MTTRTFWLIALVALGGCQAIKDALGQEPNPAYCEAHPEEQFCKDAFPDAELPGCTNNDQCATPTAVCETTTKTCVQCTPADDAACTGMTPVCSTDNACRACSAHSECASDACLPDGACAVEGSVAFVAATGTDNASCTRSQPCTKVASALATSRPYVKVGGIIDEAITINGSRTVTFLGAPGAKLTRTNNGQLLRIEDAAQVAIYDLEISGALGANVGISLPTGNTATLRLVRATVSNNAGGGITAQGGTLTISQSTISGNAGGGISLSGAAFDITNSFITKNGGGTSATGGIKIDANTAGLHRLEFSTISQNVGPMGLNTGVHCGTVLVPLTFANNIIYDNAVSGVGKQVGGANCSHSYSDIGPDAFAGTGNISTAPQFVNAAQSNFHIAATSPCKDAADPAATLLNDFDGEVRPQGAARDIGADEIP